jgi:hypothetical protein
MRAPRGPRQRSFSRAAGDLMPALVSSAPAATSAATDGKCCAVQRCAKQLGSEHQAGELGRREVTVLGKVLKYRLDLRLVSDQKLIGALISGDSKSIAVSL